jgi:hypothetical protein
MWLFLLFGRLVFLIVTYKLLFNLLFIYNWQNLVNEIQSMIIYMQIIKFASLS